MLADGSFTLRYSPDGGVAEHVPAKEHRMINGRQYVLEEGIVADFGFVKAHPGDRKGNLRFRSPPELNPLAGMSGRHTFAEVERLVEVDALHPDDIHLPGVFVDDVLLATPGPGRPTTDGEVRVMTDTLPAAKVAGRSGRGSPSGWRRTSRTATSSTSASASRSSSPSSSLGTPRWCCTRRTGSSAWAPPPRARVTPT